MNPAKLLKVIKTLEFREPSSKGFVALATNPAKTGFLFVLMNAAKIGKAGSRTQLAYPHKKTKQCLTDINRCLTMFIVVGCVCYTFASFFYISKREQL